MFNTDDARPSTAGPLTYQDRKEREVCTYPGCTEPPSDTSFKCKHHSRRHAKRQRKFASKKRELWAKKGMCLRCGAKRFPERKHCGVCLVAIGQCPRSADKHGDKKRALGIGIVSVDRDGRRRNHGQGKRGRMSIAATDAKDLEYAAAALKRGVDGLELAASPVVAALPRIQREDVKRASEAELFQAYRFLGEVLARHRVIDPVADEDED